MLQPPLVVSYQNRNRLHNGMIMQKPSRCGSVKSYAQNHLGIW